MKRFIIKLLINVILVITGSSLINAQSPDYGGIISLVEQSYDQLPSYSVKANYVVEMYINNQEHVIAKADYIISINDSHNLMHLIEENLEIESSIDLIKGERCTSTLLDLDKGISYCKVADGEIVEKEIASGERLLLDYIEMMKYLVVSPPAVSVELKSIEINGSDVWLIEASDEIISVQFFVDKNNYYLKKVFIQVISEEDNISIFFTAILDAPKMPVLESIFQW
jgi:hypothetical protein